MIVARISTLAMGVACGLAALPAVAATGNVEVYGLLTVQPATGIDIVFNYDYDSFGFLADSNRRALLEAAASVYESRIEDSLNAITTAGGSNYQVFFNDPSNPANTIQLPGGNNSIYTVAANQIIVYVGGSSMGGNSLGLGGSGSWSASGSPGFLQNVRTRGQTGVDSDTDYSLWGGFISFNKDYANWFFDPTPATSNDISGIDFYSVVVHELAHVLGFGIADSWDHWVSGTTFDGPNTPATALTSDRAHWAQGTTSPINGVGSFEAALDPNITNGTRKELTDLDWNGLRDVGWQVAAVPEPETWATLLAGLGLVGAVTRRRRG